MPTTEEKRERHQTKVALITEDAGLLQSVALVVARAHAFLAVARSRSNAEAMLTSDEYAIKIVDHGSTALVPFPSDGCATCPVVRSAVQRDEVVLLMPKARGGTCTVRGQVYARAALDVLVDDVAALLPNSAENGDRHPILGETTAIKLVRDQVASVAHYHDVSVMILGETGTGKELVAQAIHRLGGASQRPFVALNCAAIPEHLFESELFGHEAGAFTGARGTRVGLLEAADRGTVFLDEVGEMPLAVQPKLLRVLETRRFRRLGSNRDIEMGARVVSATNRDLAGFSGQHLRSDLLYRLAGFTITLPSLRERVDDIETLAHSFLREFCERHRKQIMRFSPDALALLRSQAWPGNVRELRALVEQAAILAADNPIGAAPVRLALSRLPRARLSSLPPASIPSTSGEHPISQRPASGSLPPGSLRDLEREMILAAYDGSERNLTKAAKQLDIPRSTLRDKLRRLGAL